MYKELSVHILIVQAWPIHGNSHSKYNIGITDNKANPNHHCQTHPAATDVYTDRLSCTIKSSKYCIVKIQRLIKYFPYLEWTFIAHKRVRKFECFHYILVGRILGLYLRVYTFSDKASKQKNPNSTILFHLRPLKAEKPQL